MLDTDNDGVANTYQEANTPAGTLVNTKGVSVDSNNNNVP
jgi:OOP family OmpA-OmpF porin